MTDSFATRHEVTEFISLFESGLLPRDRWTHRGHLVAGFGTESVRVDEALRVVRARIRRHNEAVGTPNTDSSGYYETHRAFLTGIRMHRAEHEGLPFEASLAALLASPLAESRWPLTFYSSERLLSVEARRQWVEPDLQPLPTGTPQVSVAALER
jgi:hypothetical protein